MLKTYPVDFVERKRMAIIWSLLSGLIGAILFFVADVFGGNVFLIGLAGVISLVALTVFLWAVAALIGIEWCDGNVLEVENDKVLLYHEQPFFYAVKSLKERQLVSFEFEKQVKAAKTLHMVLGGKTFSFELACVVMANNFQRFYDAFLRTERRIKAEPESVVNACVATFLHQQRAGILDDFRQNADIPARGLDKMREAAREYLRGELERYGFMICDVVPVWDLQSTIVE